MKILFATEDYYPLITGGAKFERGLVLALTQKGHDVRVVVPSLDFQNHEEKDFDSIIYRQRSLPVPFYPPYRNSILPFRRVSTIIETLKPDIVHVHNGFGNGLAALRAAKKFNLPVVSTNHTMPHNFLSFLVKFPVLERTFYPIGWKYIIWFNNQASFVTSPSQIAVNLLKENGLKVPAKAISNGIDLKRFHLWKEKEDLKKKFNLPDVPVVLYTGRLDKEKEVDILIKAVSLALKEVKMHLVISGNGTQKKEIISLVKESGMEQNVTFQGFLPEEDFPKIYGVGDIYTIASKAELLSITTLEAMASGLPILARNEAALKGLVKNGENGYLFDTVEELSGKITKVLRDKELKEKMSLKSLEFVQEHDWKKTVEGYESVYFNLKTQSANLKTIT